MRKPVRAKDYDASSGFPWIKLGLGGAGLYFGGKWFLNKPYIAGAGELRYLNAQFAPIFGPNWPGALGYGRTAGRWTFSRKEWFLNLVKGAEEMFGGIPRTFDFYSTAFQKSYSGILPNSEALPAAIKGRDLEVFRKYYETLTGRKFTPEIMRRGIGLGLYPEGKGKHVGLFVLPETNEMYDALRRGEYKFAQEDLLLRNARARIRYWNATAEGRGHLSRNALAAQRSLGVEAIGQRNRYPFLIEGESGALRFGRESELASLFGTREFKVPGIVERGVKGAERIGTSLSNRYFYLLDNPVELFSEAFEASRSPTLQRIIEHPFYEMFIKNKFGTGGKYGGSMLDLWARHAKKIVPIVGGAALAYAAVSSVTRTVSNTTPAQLGGAAVAGAQLAYTGLGEASGLNVLSRYQEKVAPGSTSPLALLGAGLAGGLTGMVGELLYDWKKFGKEHPGEWFYHHRQVPIKVAEDSLLKRIPGIGRLFEGEMSHAALSFKVGGLAGLALMIPFIPGMLGTTKTPEQLEQEFTGERLVPVRKNRWWEFGRNPFEGSEIETLSPSWFAELWNEYQAKELEGKYYNKPLTKMLKGITNPYYLEKLNYYKYPTPETGSYTSGYGPLGPIWDYTVGSVIKPPAYMHLAEWGGPGKEQVLETGNEAPDYGLGGLPPQEALSQYSLKYKFGETFNRFTTAIGLPGFLFNAIKQPLTGTQGLFVDQPVYENAAYNYSFAKSYYESRIGGLLSATESFRRVVPGERWELEQRNTIPNSGASWLPDYLRYGNVLRNGIGMATRLPGAGFEALHPELQGFLGTPEPEDYPALAKLKILGDLARKTRNYKEALAEAQQQVNKGSIAPEDYNAVMNQLAMKESGRRFAPEEGRGPLGWYYQQLKDIGRASPLEYALPLAPVHKFMGPTTVGQQYYENKMIGPEAASWYNPIESFIKPAFRIGLHDIGVDYVPGSIQEKRDIAGEFDALQYLKNQGLAAQGKYFLAQRYQERAERTFAGTPAQTPSDLTGLFPRAQAGYYRAFLNAPTDTQLEMLKWVPEYQRSAWELGFDTSNAGTPAHKKSLLLEQSESNQILSEYLSNAQHSRWNFRYQRFVSDVHAAEALSGEAPPPSWGGWDEGQNLEDIKLQVVKNEGYDHHDFNLYGQPDLRLGREPYAQALASKVQEKKDNWNLHQAASIIEGQEWRPTGMSLGPLSPLSRINIHLAYDNRKQTRERMRHEGYTNS